MDEGEKSTKDFQREEYILRRVGSILGYKKVLDKFKKLTIEHEDTQRNLNLFLDENDTIGYLLFVQGKGESAISLTSIPAPNDMKKKAVLLYKTSRGNAIESDNIREMVGFVELTKNVLESMSLLCQEVFLPVLSNPQNQQGWSDLVSKDLIENKFHQFLSTIYVTIGEVKGRTMLPIPPQETTTSERISSKDKAHVLEGAVITWTKQIKNVLKQDPETALKSGADPSPLVELDFWMNKAENLNSIHRQLQSEKIRKVIKFLEQNKSTYTGQFSKLQKEVQAARLEANDNNKYLSTLELLFNTLVDDSQELIELEKIFVPIMHTILLIWNHSEYYNTPARLVVLIREICNAIITQACNYLSGPDIFTFIENEEASIAAEKLSLILDIIAKFKEAYYEYKSRANDTWNITTNALFVRLDAFAERCQDIQHLTNTIVQFMRLDKIDIGGTKGETLTDSVKQIYNEFQEAVEEFRSVEYNIMDVSKKEFDDDFYEFRLKIKELERRLASILTQGFDDCDTIYGRFKLLDSFEGLLNRPIIQDELEKKHITLLESYKQDLKTVQQIFLESKPLVDRIDDKAPISKNMPPVTGSIIWTRGLIERIKEPMEKLSSLNQAVLEREEYKDVQKLYASLIKQLTEYQTQRIKDWEHEIEEIAKDKLKEPLLARDSTNDTLLKVNFDAALTRLLREVKYFALIDMNVPQTAQDIFAKNEVYRTQTGNLDIIVGMYNEIKQTLLPVEEPLLEDRIVKMDQTLEPGLRDLKWRSNNISEFIHASMIVVKEVNTIVLTMQSNLQKIKDTMAKWSEKPLLERRGKLMSPEDFDQAHKASIAVRRQDIIAGGKEINRYMKETGECVKNARQSAHWPIYVDYVNQIVIDGLAHTINISLNHLSNLFDHVLIKKTGEIPLFDVRIELIDKQVQYTPTIGCTKRENGLRDLVHSWIEDFENITTLFQRIDGHSGDYLIEITTNFDVFFGISKIETHMEWIISETDKFKSSFMEYSYLWMEDLNKTFSEFLEQGAKSGNPDEEEDYEKLEKLKSHPIFAGVTMIIPELELFDEKITNLKYIQSKVSSVQSPHTIAWLRINVDPLIQSLKSRVLQWINIYTSFLLSNVTNRMKNLSAFITEVSQGIKLKDDENIPKELLMKIITHIRDVRTVTEVCDSMFLPMREQVTLLKRHGVQMEGELVARIEDLKTRWEDLKSQVHTVKAVILPHQTEETKEIKKRLRLFEDKVSDFRQNFTKVCPFDFGELNEEIIRNSYVIIDEQYVSLLEIEQEAKDYNNLNELFELEKSQYKQLKDCRAELGNLKTLWDAISIVNFSYQDWKSTLWDKIDTEDLLDQNKNLDRLVKTLPKELKIWRGYNNLMETVKNIATILPLINELHSPSMEPRHWGQLMQITGKQIAFNSPNFCLDDLLHLRLHEHEEDVREIVSQSQREATIERKLNIIEAAWAQNYLSFDTHKDCPVIQPLDEIIEMYELHSMDLMAMQSGGKSVEHFRERLDYWLQTLKTVESVLSVWLKVQRNWKRLETIFLASDDIRSQLPSETKAFEQVDSDFRDIMTDAKENPLITEATTAEGREETLMQISEQIVICENALNDYLEGKKKSFPRFYFVSNQALLDILSNGTNCHKVCEYLGDCFDGLKALEFEKDANDNKKNIARGMYSKEFEYIEFPKTINDGKFVCEGQVENWLSDLEAMMRKSLKNILEGARLSADNWEIPGEKTRDMWIDDYPAQLSLVTTQIIFTEEVYRVIDEVFVGSEGAMKDYYKLCNDRISSLIKRVLNPDLTFNERTKIITIITIDVHGRGTVSRFAQLKVSDTTSFQWQKEIKFEWKGDNDNDANKDCAISICDWRTKYSYEYVGNCGRLVITPLTDRCYITLTQALNLTMGGAPAGPAGTGKTETTKDLGRAIGLPVMVFNCSEQMNYSTMAQIFMGLAQTGAWGCFDEFNRIKVEVLSVVSSQVKTILDAQKTNKTRFMFLEEEIGLINTVGFFITMNPGYAGRAELPENLKALFRSCAMVVPDTVLICENMLMSEGFITAQLLSDKFVTLYSLSRDLLSKQKHYDWGLRAVKSVLRMAGRLRRGDPNDDENTVLMRALRDFNLPKIVTTDKPIFGTLIRDLFPGIDPEPKLDQQLQAKLIDVAKKSKLQPERLFIKKSIELDEILFVRHCVFIIGDPGCGKTEVWKSLAKVDPAVTIFETLNPKAITSDELYGAMTKTKEWKDGVLSVIMRDMSKCNPPYKEHHTTKWIILDGDIDPDWIESMNTVMDDNKVLTLVSNERIALTTSMRLLFEISNLREATPATVSRAGVLYINPTDIGYKPYMESWLDTIEDDIARSHFMFAYQQIIEGNIEDILKFDPIVPTVPISMIQTLCCILKSLMNSKKYKDVEKTLKEDDKKAVFEAFFFYAGCWAFGGAIGDDRLQAQFNSWWRHISKKYPDGGTVYDYYYDPEALTWCNWSDHVGEFIPLGDQAFSNIIVPTVDIVKLKAVIELHTVAQKPTIFIGASGTGKTTVVRDYIAGLNSEEVINAGISFNSYTNSLTLQRFIENNVEKRMGKEFGPPAGKIMVFFIDDLNMPVVGKYGTQEPIALMIQIINYKQMYDRDHLEEQKRLKDCIFMSCMNPKSGSFTVDLRLQRHFTTFSTLLPSNEVLIHIYKSILGAHLQQFDPSIQKLTDKLIQASIDIFKLITNNPDFSPSARKFHYQFNLRDISRVIGGLLQSHPSMYRGQPEKMVRLWIHECERVYLDRLIMEHDEQQVRDYLKKCVSAFTEDLQGQEVFVDDNIFTSFVTAHGGNDKMYIPIKDMAQLKKVLEESLVEYNESNAVMNLVLFDLAMEHVCRIARIIDQPAGNALLVGVGGSGKQSLSRLASFILGYEVIQILVTDKYQVNDLQADLQEMYKKAAIKAGGTPCVFLLNDTQITDERFLISINDILSSGYVQDLFPKEELDGIYQSVRNEAKAAGYMETPDQLLEFFINKARNNLHIILCFSPVGDDFRIRSRKFPALISCTSIDWFHGWPRDALVDVANRFLGEIELQSEEIRESMSQYMADVHVSVNEANQVFLAREKRKNYTTPKSFLELIAFYKKLLSEKRQKLSDAIERLVNGLDTLQLTKSQVEGLKQDLDAKMEQVKERQAETNELIAKVEASKDIARAEQEAASGEEEEAATLTEAANKLKEEASIELAAAEPAMLRAKEAVDCLTKPSIQELKSLKEPPGPVNLVTKAVLLMRGEKKNFAWTNAQRMMNPPPKFIDELTNYDKENIDEWVLDQLQPLLAESAFNRTDMARYSSAASNLCFWVVNVVEYNRIYKKVKPLMERKQAAEEESAKKEQELSVVRAKVKEVTDRVTALEAELNEANEVKEKVEAEADACLQKLQLAERLVNGLADENKRWGENVVQFRVEENTVIGDALLAAAFVSYIGPFSAVLRLMLWQDTWLPNIQAKQIPFTEGVDPLRVLCTDSDEAKWKNFGLPADRMSIENASIVSSCSRWPLIIDPQLQGSRWIRGMHGEDLEVIQLSQSNWIKKLESCIQLGKTVMMENLGTELDAVLEPLLARAIIRKGKSICRIKLGSEEIDYNEHFKLYLQTQLNNPHYRPEIAAQCTIINFIVTESGLDDQLLATVVNIEKSELEQEKQELVKRQNDFKVILSDLEEQLLQRLSSADQSTILSNIDLIEGLEKTKETSSDIKQQTIQAQITEKKINEAREVYRCVSVEGAMLYFLIIALYVVKHMYQYSLESFITFFLKAIDKTPQYEEVEERVLAMRESIRMTIFQWVSRGLFEQHKQIFLMQITLRLMQKAVISTPYDIQMVTFLLQAPIKPGVEKPQALDWLPDTSWDMVQKLIDIEEFNSFATSMEKDAPTRFKEWFNDLAPEELNLPLDWKRLNGTFQKLLVLRCLRPDRLTLAIDTWLKDALPNGVKYVEVDSGMSFGEILESVLEDAVNTTPIFFILSPGTDPVVDVERSAKRRHIEEGKNYWNVAMGQGTEDRAMRYLENGHKEGHWVMLQNIHLMPDWLRELEKKLDNFAQEGSNINFRLFLSAEPSDLIPISILDRSIKLTNEPPTGMKANVKRAFAQFNKDEFQERDPRVKSIIFGLCFFHATVIERRKFGAKGWNRGYPFSMGDLRDSALVLINYLEGPQSSSKIPWDDLRYIFGEIMYGGHITDDWDRILCMTYLNNLMDNPLLDETELFPFSEGTGASFKSPAPTDYGNYILHIDENFGQETPIAFGMHPNAEIGFRTNQCTILFKTLVDLQPNDEGGEQEEGVKTRNEVIQEVVTQILEDMGIEGLRFDLEDIRGKFMEDDDKLCFINVFLQECEYMNYLLNDMLTSLQEINLALNGELTATEQMDRTMDSLVLERVPVRWELLAYPSCRGLTSWLVNLQSRIEQLQTWKDNPTEVPKVTNISRLFNPQSFLTAVKQYYAQKTQSELNRLQILTDVTKRMENEIDAPAREGAFITGLNLEGARWDIGNSQLESSKPKEMFCPLPIVNCRSALQPPGEFIKDKNTYYCPCYKTEDRGATYVFTAQLRTPRAPPDKWVLAGVALILDVEGIGDAKK